MRIAGCECLWFEQAFCLWFQRVGGEAVEAGPIRCCAVVGGELAVDLLLAPEVVIAAHSLKASRVEVQVDPPAEIISLGESGIGVLTPDDELCQAPRAIGGVADIAPHQAPQRVVDDAMHLAARPPAQDRVAQRVAKFEAPHRVGAPRQNGLTEKIVRFLVGEHTSWIDDGSRARLRDRRARRWSCTGPRRRCRAPERSGGRPGRARSGSACSHALPRWRRRLGLAGCPPCGRRTTRS